MKNLTTVKSSKVTLSKTKSLLSLTDSILDDDWILRLIEWADKNNIPDLELSYSANSDNYDTHEYTEYRYNNDANWRGLPRTKELLEVWELYLTNYGIDNIPKEIGKLTYLISLDLSDNYILDIPKEIINLIDLEVLNIEDNNITKLPVELLELKNLRILNISNNNIIENKFHLNLLQQLRDNNVEIIECNKY